MTTPALIQSNTMQIPSGGPPPYGPSAQSLLDSGYVPLVRKVDTLAELAAIFEPEVQICYWPRPVPDALLEDNVGLDTWRGQHVVERAPSSAATAATALGADIEFLLELYVDLLDCPATGVRLEELQHAMCPSFHVDHTGIRLTCAYRGPGTEWHGREVSDVDTRNLPGSIAGAPTGAIVLVKGTRWPGNALRGGIHRSPPQPSKHPSRIILTIDALWR